MKRLFIGVPIISEIAVHIVKKWQDNQQLNLNQMIWGIPENWHITLFFLGNTPETAIKLLQQFIEDSFSMVPGFSAQLNGVGVFPNQHNPKVLWLGLETLEPLMVGYGQLGDLLQQNGFGFDNKPLKPHLTLARIKRLENKESLGYLLNKYEQSDFGRVAIDRIVLFESILTQQGPIYKPLFVKELVT